MTNQFTGAPIFNADAHMYETADSLTKYLPEKYSRAVQFAQICRQGVVEALNHPQPIGRRVTFLR
jgi:hypothetical protein